MAKRRIALNLRRYSYSGLLGFVRTIYAGMLKEAVLFPAPSPTLNVFLTAINKMNEALSEWGKGKGTHGSTKARTKLLNARDRLHDYLRLWSAYVMITRPGDIESWLKVGFVLKKLYSRTGTLSAVQNLHQFIARNIQKGDIKLKWKRPLDTPDTTNITYIILRSDDEHFANAKTIGVVVRKATYTDTPPKAGVVYFYWVVPVTAAGPGVYSGLCRAFASPV